MPHGGLAFETSQGCSAHRVAAATNAKATFSKQQHHLCWPLGTGRWALSLEEGPPGVGVDDVVDVALSSTEATKATPPRLFAPHHFARSVTRQVLVA